MTPEDAKYRELDAIREANLSYWSALLSTNGIFITVFSALAAFDKVNVWLAIALLLVSVISSWLLITNFKAVRTAYEDIARQSAEDVDRMTDEQRKADIDNQARRGARAKLRERWIVWLLVCQILIIAAMLATSHALWSSKSQFNDHVSQLARPSHTTC
jgi:hypothetical protein